MKQLILDRAKREDKDDMFINGKNSAYRSMTIDLNRGTFYRKNLEGEIKLQAHWSIESTKSYGDTLWYPGKIQGFLEVLCKIKKREEFIIKELGFIGTLDFNGDNWIFHSYKLVAPFLWKTWEVAKKEIKKLKKIYKNA